MSLVRIGVRIAAVEAIRNRTLVGGNVLDSEIAALDIGADGVLRTCKEKPFIAVYTGAAVMEQGGELRALNQNGLTEIEFEMGISAGMTETDPETGVSTVIQGIPATDRAFEFHLDMVARQIGDALTDPDNEWAELFRGLVIGIRKVEQARTASGHIGIKIAGRQIRLTAALVDDPLRGMELPADAPFARLLAKMAASENTVVQAQAAMMQAQLADDDHPWEAVQRGLGMTGAELLALGLGPLSQDEDRETPVAELATLELDGGLDIEVEPENG